MDTIIVNNHAFPVIPDSIAVKTDYSLLVDRLESLVIQNQISYSQLEKAIIRIGEKEKLFGLITWDTFFTVLTPILVLLLGFFIERYIKYREKVKRRRDARRYIEYHLKNITEKYTSRLLYLYKNLSKETTIESGIKLTPPEIISSDFQRVLNIDSREIFNSFQESEEISKIISQIELINTQNKRVKDYHSNFRESNNKLKELLFNKSKELLEELIHFKDTDSEILSPHVPSPEAIKIGDILTDYYNNRNNDKPIQSLKTKLLSPIIWYVEVNEILKVTIRIKRAYNSCIDLHSIISKLEAEIIDFKDQYNDFAEVLEMTNKRIKDSMKKINWD